MGPVTNAGFPSPVSGFPAKLIEDSHQPNVPQWVPISGSDYPKKPDLTNELVAGKNKIIYSAPSVISGSNANILDSNIISQSHPSGGDIVNPLIDSGIGPNSLIYFNPSSNPIHQPMYPSTFMHGLHQNSLQSLQQSQAGGGGGGGGGHLLGPANQPQLILHAQHYPTFYPQNQSFHLRPFWPNQNITDLSGNPIFYASTNNANVRHVIGAGGNGGVNSNLR